MKRRLFEDLVVSGPTRLNGAPIAEPNVTPLIDVMLVLIILFMVVTPVVHRGLDASLPAPPARQDRGGPVTTPVIAVRADDVELDGDRLASMAELEAHLGDALATRADRTVYVRAVGAVSYGRVVEAVDAAKGAGADRIGLITPATAPTPAGRARP